MIISELLLFLMIMVLFIVEFMLNGMFVMIFCVIVWDFFIIVIVVLYVERIWISELLLLMFVGIIKKFFYLVVGGSCFII